MNNDGTLEGFVLSLSAGPGHGTLVVWTTKKWDIPEEDRITRGGLLDNRATGPISVSVDSQCSRSGAVNSEAIGNSP